jgi:hypothetical protein
MGILFMSQMRAFFKVLAFLMLVMDGVVVAQEVWKITDGISASCSAEGGDTLKTIFIPSAYQRVGEGGKTLVISFEGEKNFETIVDIGGYGARGSSLEPLSIPNVREFLGDPEIVGFCFSQIIFTGDIWPHTELMEWLQECDAIREKNGLEELDVEWRNNRFSSK